MIIQACRLLPYRLPFRQAWQTHRGVLRERGGWILELTTDDGRRGYGDCAPLLAAGSETAAAAQRWLTRRLPALQDQSPDELIKGLPLPTKTPAARHALETALLDLISQSEGLSLRRWLSPRAVDRIAVNGSAGVLEQNAAERCGKLLEQGFTTLKLKVGLARVTQELRWLEQLCGQLPAHISLRLDANGAWSLAQAQEFLRNLPETVIESLEEPLAEPLPERLAMLQGMTRTNLALDESLAGIPLEQLLEQPPVRRLVLKPTVLGGLQPSMDLARRAVKAGLEVLVTSTLESAVGIHAAAQLAAALDPADGPLAHGLATSDWFVEDVAHALEINNGQLLLPDVPGLGIRMNQ
ncbi:MAG: o-succinylbenzoate synthase [Pseudomonadota bacterium]